MNYRYKRIESTEDEIEGQVAVQVVNVRKSYGIGLSKTQILSGINLILPKGQIFGLLGPSGCGKTTLVKSITGLIRPDSGYIKVFGHLVGSKASRIPGDGVGYMPQEISLYGEFTIKETMNYFGYIYNMSKTEINERTQFLLKLLQLPHESSYIKQLSGGQTRRVSFAISLFQNARLLILDEPTVGVDPLLRQQIWEHLLKMVNENGISVIFITHYIDEIKKVNVVGMMRDGQILAEDTPNNLLETYNKKCLNDVFLNLCNKIDEKSNNTATPNGINGSTENDSVKFSSKNLKIRQNRRMPQRSFFDFKMNRTRAIIGKNYIDMRRNIGALLLQCILPIIQISLVCLSLGRKPADLTIGYINDDDSFLHFGQEFLHVVDKRTITLKEYHDMDTALAAIKENEIWGLVHLPPKFSVNLLTRFLTTINATDEVLEGSKIRIWLDNVDQQILITLRMELLITVKKFAENVLKSYGFNPSLVDLPVDFETHDLEFNDDTIMAYLNFLAPGFCILLAYFLPVGLSNLTFLLERKHGLIERIYVAGVTDVEVIAGFFAAHGLVMTIQICLTLVFAIDVFNIPCVGSLFLISFLLFLQGWAGLFHGLIVSALFGDEYIIIVLQATIFFTCLLLSGSVWPIEGMPKLFRIFSYFIPQRYPIETSRAIMLRGWGLTRMIVWRGVLTSIVWLSVLVLLLIVVLKNRRYTFT